MTWVVVALGQHRIRPDLFGPRPLQATLDTLLPLLLQTPSPSAVPPSTEPLSPEDRRGSHKNDSREVQTRTLCGIRL